MNWGTLCCCLGWTSRAYTYRFRTTEILHFPKEPRTVLWQGSLLLEIDAHILPLVTTDLLLFKVGTSPYVTSSYLLDKIPSSSEVGTKSCTFGGTEVGPDSTSSLCPRPLCLSKADVRTPGSQASDDSTIRILPPDGALFPFLLLGVTGHTTLCHFILLSAMVLGHWQ